MHLANVLSLENKIDVMPLLIPKDPDFGGSTALEGIYIAFKKLLRIPTMTGMTMEIRNANGNHGNIPESPFSQP